MTAWRRRRYPAVENVVMSGWTKALNGCMEREIEQRMYHDRRIIRFPNDLLSLCDWNAVRPRDILRMGRKAAAMGREWNWDYNTLALWTELLNFYCLFPDNAEDYQRYVTEYGLQNVLDLSGCVSDGADFTIPEVDRYLHRQSRKYELPLPDGLRLFLDYRNMLDAALGRRTPTPDERWPKSLRAAHDRFAAAQRARPAAGFREILERWGRLEWTDGECRAVLPRSHADLIDEGHTLHHCVGSYANEHAKGRIIVFIRRYRRPERSWFTLNEDLTGDRPRRIQLHGYGNDFAHGKRLTIPQKVLDFCDRWEEEVLFPVFREVKRQEAEAKSRKRIRTRAAP